jgi:hypothetical protein
MMEFVNGKDDIPYIIGVNYNISLILVNGKDYPIYHGQLAAGGGGRKLAG